MALHEVNRAKLVQSMIEKIGSATTKGLILLEGGKQTTRYDTDHEPVFRQESYFHYLFGAALYADCFGVISLPEGETTLFVPTWGVDTETVCGASPKFEIVQKELGVERVLGVGDLKGFVEGEMERMRTEEQEDEKKSSGTEDKAASSSDDAPKLYLLHGLNSDSGNYATPAFYEGIENFKDVRDEDTLFGCLVECRVIKVSRYIEPVFIL